jgi:hypothetical protein
MHRDSLDVSLHDADLLDEVHLMTDVVIAAQDFSRHLTTAEIDEVLGISAQRVPAPRTGSPRVDQRLVE